MKKIVLILLLAISTTSLFAEDYAYLVFEKSDGSKTAVAVEAITITIADGKLTAGGQTFLLADLTKMYFSTTDVTKVESVSNSGESSSEKMAIYDLSGRKMDGSMPKKGVVIVKMNDGRTKKVVVK